jgi:hypothetical protein
MARGGGYPLLGAPRPGKGAESRPARGRRCTEPGCGTVLSTYNRSSTCYLHTPPTHRRPLDRT